MIHTSPLALQRLSQGIKCNPGGLWQLSNLPWHIIMSEVQTPKVYIRKTPECSGQLKTNYRPCYWFLCGETERGKASEKIEFPFFFFFFPHPQLSGLPALGLLGLEPSEFRTALAWMSAWDNSSSGHLSCSGNWLSTDLQHNLTQTPKRFLTEGYRRRPRNN